MILTGFAEITYINLQGLFLMLNMSITAKNLLRIIHSEKKQAKSSHIGKLIIIPQRSFLASAFHLQNR